MCYESDETPPSYGSPSTTVESGARTLTSSDGTEFAAYLAQPARTSGVGVLVLPDNRGLSGFYEQLAIRLAEHGYPAVAVDYFGRTAGLDYHSRRDTFADLADVLPHLAKLSLPQLIADFAAGAAALRETTRQPPGPADSFPEADSPAHVGGSGADRVVVLGCCIGGRFGCQAAAKGSGFAGVISLYGYPDELNGRPGPTQQAAAITAPILALWGGADPGIPPSTVDRFDTALTMAGVPHQFVTYPGAPHGFFEESQPEYANAQADVWRRMLQFLANAGTPPEA